MTAGGGGSSRGGGGSSREGVAPVASPAASTARDRPRGRDDGSRRTRGVVLHVPVVHGSHAVWLGPEKADESRTHRWHVYLRALDTLALDLSHFIDHVEFVLHESFRPPSRIVSTPPYELVEHGWGEFDILVRVHFRCSVERPVEFYHPLKLFPAAPPGAPPGPPAEPTRTPVVAEFYDEIVFQDPTENMLKLLQLTQRQPNTRISLSPLAHYYTDFSGAEGADLKRIEEAQTAVAAETAKKGTRYDELCAEQEALNRELSELATATSAAQAKVASGERGGAEEGGRSGKATGGAVDMVLSP